MTLVRPVSLPRESVIPYLGTALVRGQLRHLWFDGTLLLAYVGSDGDGAPSPRYLDEPASAAYLGVPVGRLKKWRKERRIACFKPTHQTTLYDSRDLDALMSASRIEATTPPPRPQSKPKSDAHKAAIAEAQRAAWARRKADKLRATPAPARPVRKAARS